MTTIKDVAREAGVSVTTVSHVVNTTRPVAAETRRRVCEVIERLGYRPSGIAKALKSNRAHALGMLVTTSANPFFAEVIRGVEAGCFERGYTLILGNTGDSTERLEAYWHTLAARRIDGLVVMASNASPDFMRRLASDQRLPLVALDTGEGLAPCVVNDDSGEGGRLAGTYLVRRGFSHIGCVTGPPGHPRCATRLNAFRAGVEEAGGRLDPAFVIAGDLTIAGGYRALVELMQRPQLPDALFCINDMLAMGVLCAANDHTLRVPEDLSVMGYDDSEMAAYMAPPLTTVRQPAFEMGRTAAGLLIERVEQARPLPSRVALTPTLVERKSVGWGRLRSAIASG